MINVGLFGISLTLSLVSNAPEVPFYFLLEFTTIFYIKSNAMPFSAFKLKKTHWQKII